MDKEKIKEMKKFSIMCLIMGTLVLVTALFIMQKDSESSGFLCVGSGILYAIGFSLLPKAIKLEKLNKNQDV